MASTSAIAPVCSAALAALRANSAVLARVPVERILDTVPARITGQYILVESAGERPQNTMGGTADALKWGSVAGLRIRTIGQYPVLDTDVWGTLSTIKGCLDGQPLTVTGYPTVSVDFFNATMLESTLNGVPTRELVADFEVTVHQS